MLRLRISLKQVQNCISLLLRGASQVIFGHQKAAIIKSNHFTMSKKEHIAPVNYEWADNKIKLHQAEAWVRLEAAKNIDVKFDEETIKARYIKIQGALKK